MTLGFSALDVDVFRLIYLWLIDIVFPYIMLGFKSVDFNYFWNAKDESLDDS